MNQIFNYYPIIFHSAPVVVKKRLLNIFWQQPQNTSGNYGEKKSTDMYSIVLLQKKVGINVVCVTEFTFIWVFSPF